MTVREAKNLLGYGVVYEIQGAYSGKTYHRSNVNSSKNFDKYADREVTESPFYTDMRLRGTESNRWCMPVVTISMYDYDLCKH